MISLSCRVVLSALMAGSLVAGTREAQPRPPRRVALLIGLSSYKNFPASGGEPGRSQLRAPVANDLPRMRKSLERWGFEPGDNVLVLADSEASKAGIEAGFRWLIGRATDPSDVVVVYYSGHGSWAPDRDGDEARVDSRDSVDEGLVPWDASDIHDARQLVIDDQIREWLSRLVTSNVTVIVDACFSGTITRGEREGRVRGPAPPPGSARPRGALDITSPRHTLITAASAGQTASEIPFETATGQRYFGVLTWFLTRALDAADSATRYDELVRRVRSDVVGLSGRITPQEPQLEGDRAALLFRVRRPFAPRPVATVTSVTDGRLTLDVGAVNDVRLGTVYDVYAPGDTRFRGATAVAQIEIDSVAEVRSFARATAPDASVAVTPGSRALLALVPAGARRVDRVRVTLDGASPQLQQALAALSFVTLVDSAPDAVVRVAAGVARVEVGGRGLPPLTASEERDQIAGTAYVPTASALCPPLRRALWITALGGIENPVPAYIPVQMRLVRDSAPPDVIPMPATDTVVVGQRYNLFVRVAAPPTSTLYLTVAVGGYASSPSVVYPLAGRAASIPLNRWERLADGITIDPPEGSDVLKAVVSSRPFDLRPLFNGLPRCETGSRGNTPERWRPRPEPVTGWTTAERPIVVVRSRAGR